MKDRAKWIEEDRVPSVKELADWLIRKCSTWTRDEQEDGGQVEDHLSDDISRDTIAKIPQQTWDKAWEIFENADCQE